MRDHIFNHFKEASDLIIQSADSLSAPIADAIEIMSSALIRGNKILSCGNGGSAADAQHFSSELMGRFERERNPFPSIALTTDTAFMTAVSNDYDFNMIFSRQIQALGHVGDVLLALSTSGNSNNVIAAVEAAHKVGMHIVALIGREGGELGTKLNTDDCRIQVTHTRTARIQEMHGLIIHCICDGIDNKLCGWVKH